MAAMVETATEVSSGHWPRIESWLALWAIAALVAAPCCVCQDQSWRYGVGGESGDWSFNWRHPDTPSYYQDWADRLMLLYKLYVNDSLCERLRYIHEYLLVRSSWHAQSHVDT